MWKKARPVTSNNPKVKNNSGRNERFFHEDKLSRRTRKQSNRQEQGGQRIIIVGANESYENQQELGERRIVGGVGSETSASQSVFTRQ